MSLILHSTPAERQRGCSLAEGFESQAAVEADGWAVTGAPTFSARDGVTLDGSSDYLVKNLCGSEFNSAGLSIVVEFTPDFNWDENAVRYLLEADDGASADRYYIYKQNAAANHIIGIRLGNTFIGNIAAATYAAHWRQGSRNVLVLSATTGDTSVWLNGAKIMDADATAWSAADPTVLHVGSNMGGSSVFDGTIHRLQIYKVQLEDQEALDICSGATYRYLDGASLVLLGDTASHDAANHRVLDVSGNAANVDLGDGAGTGEPTKITEHGYSFDGVDDYLGLPTLSGNYTASILDRDGNGQIEITHETVSSVYTDIGTSGSYSKKLMALVVCPEVLTTMQRHDLEQRMRSWARRE